MTPKSSKSRERYRLLSVVLLLLVLTCGPGSALTALAAGLQENNGAIQGTVKDQSGAVIPGAKVTATSPAMPRPMDATSDAGGNYRFQSIPVGKYTLTVTQSGFKTVSQQDVEVQLNKTTTADFDMPAGQVSETVTVTAGGESIDLTSSKAATNITEQIINNTPKGRGFNSLLPYAPGVIYDTRAGSAGGGATGTSGNNPGGGVGGYSVNGGSGSENAFVIDGVEVSNVRNAALGRESAIPFDFVREIQVKSGGYEAEYGGATGGVINVITKSGTNDFHGEGALMFTNAGLNSAPRGFWQRVPGQASLAEFFRQKEDEYRTFYPVFSLGGPILKDRLHFFGSYAPEISRTERNINFLSGGSKQTTQRVERHYAIGRLDYAITSNMQFNTSYLWTPIRVQGLLTGVDPRVAPPTNDLSIGGGYTPANSYTAAWTWAATSKLVFSARYGYKYLNDKGNTYGLPTAVLLLYQQPTSQQTSPPVPSQFAGAAGKQNVSNTFNVEKDVTTRHNFYFDTSYVARLFGQQHTFKGGYALNRIANEVVDDYPNGRFDFYWGIGFTRGSLNNVRGTYGYYIWEDGVKHNASASSRNHGFYVQDSWQIHPRVTINAGVRFENEFLPPFTKEVNGNPIPNPISFGWGDKIAPRIGGAWDVRGDGSWKISASWGEYYDTMKYELARTSFGGDYWHERVYRLNSPDITQVSKAHPDALGSLIIDIDNRTIPINAQGQLDGIDPDIKPMLSREFTVASEHRIKQNMIASVRYTRKHLVRGIEDIGVLDAEENEVYVIGNPGFGARSDSILCPPTSLPCVPKAKRDYDGVEFRLDHQVRSGVVKGLSYFASYTYSRLYGNWAGLANSDEAGRSQPNVSRAFDLPWGSFDAHGHLVYGRLPTDRPHQFKLFGSYQFKTAAGLTDLSLSQVAYSGTPLSSEVTIIVPVFFNGRGDLGRTPVYTQTDGLLAHSIKMGEHATAKFDINVINLFNQATVVSRTTRINRNGNIALSLPDFLAGIDVNSFLKPANSTSTPAFNPIYNLPSGYQGIREIRLGFHVIF
ncbi:MAG TPA: carboxypeptidase regulatory-like domain-containing protein [Blastocatellia bacterium]|nr:carboxypeptidase regulatory-like domain-containing protein [Blastocatellia bacterium]